MALNRYNQILQDIKMQNLSARRKIWFQLIIWQIPTERAGNQGLWRAEEVEHINRNVSATGF